MWPKLRVISVKVKYMSTIHSTRSKLVKNHCLARAILQTSQTNSIKREILCLCIYIISPLKTTNFIKSKWRTKANRNESINSSKTMVLDSKNWGLIHKSPRKTVIFQVLMNRRSYCCFPIKLIAVLNPRFLGQPSLINC